MSKAITESVVGTPDSAEIRLPTRQTGEGDSNRHGTGRTALRRLDGIDAATNSLQLKFLSASAAAYCKAQAVQRTSKPCSIFFKGEL